MSVPEPVHVVLDIERTEDTISGHVAAEDAPASGFFGWLELLDRLERAAGALGPQSESGRRRRQELRDRRRGIGWPVDQPADRDSAVSVHDSSEPAAEVYQLSNGYWAARVWLSRTSAQQRTDFADDSAARAWANELVAMHRQLAGER